MTHHSPHMLDLARQGAALRFRELADELDLLLGLFPDLGQTFDPDELPISFVIKTDAERASASPLPSRKVLGNAAKRRGARRMKQTWTERRSGART